MLTILEIALQDKNQVVYLAESENTSLEHKKWYHSQYQKGQYCTSKSCCTLVSDKVVRSSLPAGLLVVSQIFCFVLSGRGSGLSWRLLYRRVINSGNVAPDRKLVSSLYLDQTNIFWRFGDLTEYLKGWVLRGLICKIFKRYFPFSFQFTNCKNTHVHQLVHEIVVCYMHPVRQYVWYIKLGWNPWLGDSVSI